MSAQYVVGIDLGTTNSVVAFSRLDAEKSTVELMQIDQLVAPNTVEARSTLPSFAYLPLENQVGDPSLSVPGHPKSELVVGEFARRQGADLPDRTVAAAKSWLSNSRVDRHQAILPWTAESVPKVSPVAVSKRYLSHLAAEWDKRHPEAPLAQQMVVLTVPASFDASARELTREAAIAAGLPDDTVLLEEPQAAVYAWLHDTGDRWRKLLKVNDTLLVCDVGGGTTDLTLISVAQEGGELVLRRMAVGEHLLVGGENMDLALAFYVAGLLEAKGVKLDPWQSISLWHKCRDAKELLLSSGGQEKHPISILGRGGKLIGGTVTVDVERQTVADMLLSGFFPETKVADKPQRRRSSGFQDIGLPYETDTAITRHVANFLSVHGGASGPIQPTHVLFNGGVFKADTLRSRLLSVLGGWFPEAPAKPLEGEHDLDHAVARGAAHYGWAKQRGGIRIRGGAPRSYYVGIETAGLAVPGAPRPLRAVCVVPFGMEEGTEIDVPGAEVGLIVGEPAHFRFFSSSVRKDDPPGKVLASWNEEELSETDSLEAQLPASEDLDTDSVPVRFHSQITELGVFELSCASTRTPHRWKLAFSVREDADHE